MTEPSLTETPMTPMTPMTTLAAPLATAAAVIAATQLGVFDALDQAAASPTELAERLGVDHAGITCLTEMLHTVGYLERAGSRFINGAIPRAWLTSSSPVDFTPGALWSAEVFRFLGDLAPSVRRGGPSETMYQRMATHPDVGRVFAQYMKAAAQLTAAAAAQTASLPDDSARLLDLGGSHGLNSVAFCRRYPNLVATVYDLPVALPEADQTIAAEQLVDRVTTQPGDYFTDDIGHDWDVVLCFDLIHNHHAEQNRHLLTKIAAALRPGGMIVVKDFLRTDPPDAFHAAFSLIMFSENGTRTYTYEELGRWLGDAGFEGLERFDLPPTGQSSIVIAKRADRSAGGS